MNMISSASPILAHFSIEHISMGLTFGAVALVLVYGAGLIHLLLSKRKLRSPKGIKDAIDVLTRKASGQKAELEKMVPDLTQELSMVEETEKELVELSLKQASTQSELRGKQQQLQLLKTQLLACSTELSAAKDSREQAIDLLGWTTTEIGKLQREGSEATHEAEQLETLRGSAQSTRDEFVTKAKKLKGEAEERQKQSRKAEEYVKSMTAKVDLESKQAELLHKQCEEAKKRSSELQASIARNEKRRSSLTSEIQMLKKAVAPLKNEQAVLERRHQDVKGQKADLDRIQEEARKLDSIEGQFPKVMEAAKKLRKEIKQAQGA